MAKCAFFGHSQFDYAPYREKIRTFICDLIENHSVTEFYNGYRGDFDGVCAEIVFALKAKFPIIKNIMVVSYHPHDGFMLPKCFDESIYLLEKSVLPQYAISYTNQAIVEQADFIVSGVAHDWGGAWTACEYARRKNKIILNVIEGILQ